jgi:hypothetical protein
VKEPGLKKPVLTTTSALWFLSSHAGWKDPYPKTSIRDPLAPPIAWDWSTVTWPNGKVDAIHE